jgi:hypothetical protein
LLLGLLLRLRTINCGWAVGLVADERLTLPAAAGIAVVVVPACVVVVAAPRLQLQHGLTPPLQCAIIDELHHHEHVGDHKVPAVQAHRRQNAACG